MVNDMETDIGTPVDDYGVLKGDLVFIRNNENLMQAIDQIQVTLANVNREYEKYPNFTAEEKVRFDTLCAFCVNSLFWMHEKMLGRPNTVMDDIKADLDRVREAMKRLQTIHDNLTKRPRLDQPAAQRFVRAGLYDANNAESDKQNDAPPNKKKRREKKAEPE
ncbi:AGAP007147-PA [Anopheles gambiae str. PEST]|uniref:Nuclear nucleic acid-binding protein C1D n=1 Tax=Anopheles gambiae TaxID=7165 RepID=A7URQ1_ANOGA|nr:AGAP007147-PA [Anopheles gambiae str. PEST]